MKKTGGKVQSSRTRLGKNHAAHALRLAAWGLIRSKSYQGAFLHRQRSRLGSPKAVTATAHKLARIVYHLMRYGAAYGKQTEQDHAEQVRERLFFHPSIRRSHLLQKPGPRAGLITCVNERGLPVELE